MFGYHRHGDTSVSIARRVAVDLLQVQSWTIVDLEPNSLFFGTGVSVAEGVATYAGLVSVVGCGPL